MRTTRSASRRRARCASRKRREPGSDPEPGNGNPGSAPPDSVPDGATVLAVIRGGAVAVVEAMDELCAAEPELRPVRRHDAMAAPGELLLHRGGHLVLDAHGEVRVHDPARPVGARL